MVHLARHRENGSVATRRLAAEEGVSYQLACKLMQRLHNAGLVESSMINLAQVIEAIQGPLTVNRCVLGVDACPRQKSCPVSRKMIELQKHLDKYLQSITLAELVRSRSFGEKERSNAGKGTKR